MSGHHHDHDHDNHFTPIEARVKALESLMVAKGYVDPAALDAIVETYETKVGPRNGARAVADLVNGLACLGRRRGYLIGHLLGLVANTVEGAFSLFRVDDYLALNSQVRCHGCPNEKGPPKRARK